MEKNRHSMEENGLPMARMSLLPSFLSLPPEIRLLIYRCLWTDIAVCNVPGFYTSTAERQQIQASRSAGPSNIRSTCKTCHDESHSLFYKLVTFATTRCSDRSVYNQRQFAQRVLPVQRFIRHLRIQNEFYSPLNVFSMSHWQLMLDLDTLEVRLRFDPIWVPKDRGSAERTSKFNYAMTELLKQFTYRSKHDFVRTVVNMNHNGKEVILENSTLTVGLKPGAPGQDSTLLFYWYSDGSCARTRKTFDELWDNWERDQTTQKS